MTFSHDTGVYNVQASLRLWLAQTITANKPPLISTVSVRLSMPESLINCPCWSIHFLGTEATAIQYQGRNVEGGKHGTRRFGLIEVNCWASRKTTTWDAQLAQMQDAVTKTVSANTTGVPVYDFYTDAAVPTPLSYRIALGEIEVRQPPVDPNPDIERVRLLIPYHWVERS